MAFLFPNCSPMWFYNKKERYFCKYLSKYLVSLIRACAFAQSSSNTNPARTGKKAQKRAYFAGLRFKPLKRHQKNTRKGCFFGAVDRGLRIRAKFFEHEPRPHEQKTQKTGIFCGLTVQTVETASKKHP